MAKISYEMRNALQCLYVQRVDWFYKILRGPTGLADVERLQSSARNARQPASFRALELSMYIMALCSITDDEPGNWVWTAEPA